MVRAESRIVVSLVAVFVSLAGISAAIHGLLFDKTEVMRYGVLAIIVGVTSFVVLLNPTPRDEP